MSILYFKGKRGVVVREQGEKLILVVEDSDTLRKLLTKTLTEMGISSNTASDGAEAVEKASTGAYDMILMDLGMPSMDGLEATRRIREAEAQFGLPRAVIVAVTAAGTRDDCLDAGMDDCLSKPITAGHMRSVIRRWLRKSASKAASAR